MTSPINLALLVKACTCTNKKSAEGKIQGSLNSHKNIKTVILADVR